MVRRLIAVMALFAALVGVSVSAVAAATPPASETQYPAPPVTASIQVLDQSSEMSSNSATDQPSIPSAPTGSDGLAYTGVSFNVSLIVLIAIALLALGVALIAAGGRLVRRRRGHRHA